MGTVKPPEAYLRPAPKEGQESESKSDMEAPSRTEPE